MPTSCIFTSDRPATEQLVVPIALGLIVRSPAMLCMRPVMTAFRGEGRMDSGQALGADDSVHERG